MVSVHFSRVRQPRKNELTPFFDTIFPKACSVFSNMLGVEKKNGKTARAGIRLTALRRRDEVAVLQRALEAGGLGRKPDLGGSHAHTS
jgi:hypothetical protein